MCLGHGIALGMVHPRKGDDLGGWCTERCVMGDKDRKAGQGPGPCRTLWTILGTLVFVLRAIGNH